MGVSRKKGEKERKKKKNGMCFSYIFVGAEEGITLWCFVNDPKDAIKEDIILPRDFCSASCDFSSSFLFEASCSFSVEFVGCSTSI